MKYYGFVLTRTELILPCRNLPKIIHPVFCGITLPYLYGR